MDNSKVTINLLKKRLRKQKRRTFFMFLIGLVAGGLLIFNTYYWFPLLKKEFNLNDISQFPVTEESSETQPSSSKTVSSTTQDKESAEEKSAFIPRTALEKDTTISPIFETLNEQLEQTIMQYNPSGTILAIKNNQVVLFNNYGNALETNTDPINSTYMIASVQKSITAIMIMKLIEENKLTLETHLSDFYPDIPNSQNITINQMLAMTSGLSLKDKLQNTTSKEKSIEYAVNNVTYEPLEKWKYSDVNFFLLAAIIENVSKTTYEDYFDKTIRQPLHLTHTGFYNELNDSSQLVPSHTLDKNGTLDQETTQISEANYINELGTGNMYISAGDLATIIQARTDGYLISNDVLQSTLTIQPENYKYTYKAGFYDKEDRYYGHGRFRDYEPTVLFSKDASTIVIYLSNVFVDKENVALTENLFQQLNQ